MAELSDDAKLAPEAASGAASGEYVAFISYSHADKAAAQRLQNFIERFRHVAAEGEKARRLGRCFRDEDELAGGGLTPQIERALDLSRALIVICTPRASLSAWVALEIDTFRRLHPDRKIIPLWCDEGRRAGQALPGALSQLDLFVPEQAEFSEEGLFLRAVAALLGQPLDTVVQRQQALLRREQRRARLALVVGMLLIAAAIGGLGASALLGWRNALARSEILASQAQLNWDGHNPRLAGLLAIAASHGENGFLPEAAAVHPLLVDVIASPTLPVGVYPLGVAAAEGVLKYTSDGRLVIESGNAERVVVTGIPHWPTPPAEAAETQSARPCVLPAPVHSPLNEAQRMEWVATPGCRYAYALDDFGADFVELPASYNRASAGGQFRGQVTGVEASPAGKLAVTHGDGGIAYVISLNPSEIQVSQPRMQVSAVGFAADDQFLALGGEDGSVRLWIQEPDSFSPTESELVYGAPIAAGPVRAIVFAPGNLEFAVLYNEGVVARFRNEAFVVDARRLSLRGRIDNFPTMGTPVVFSADSRVAWTSDGELGIAWDGGAVPNGASDPNAVSTAAGHAAGRVSIYERGPEDVAFAGERVVAIDHDEIYALGGVRTSLPAQLHDARIAGPCSQATVLAATARALHEVRVRGAAVSRSWRFAEGGVSVSAACAADGAVVIRSPTKVASIDSGGRITVLRTITNGGESDHSPAFPVALYHNGRAFITRGEANVLLVGDLSTRRVERLVVASDADIVGYGVLPGGEFAVVGAQYGLDSAPCVEWRVLHLPTRRWLTSVANGRPGNVDCPRMATAAADGEAVYWLDEFGGGYITALPSRAHAWSFFCNLARGWSLTPAEQASYASLLSPQQIQPCGGVRVHSQDPEASPAPRMMRNEAALADQSRATSPVAHNAAAAPVRPHSAATPALADDASSFSLGWPVDSPILRSPEAAEDQNASYFTNEAYTWVKAAADGEVAYAGNDLPRYGTVVLVRHENGFITVYGYLSQTRVQVGQIVRRGDVLGFGDNRGRVLFELRRGTDIIDPRRFFPRPPG